MLIIKNCSSASIRPLLCTLNSEDRFKATYTLLPIKPINKFLQCFFSKKLLIYSFYPEEINTQKELREFSINSLLLNRSVGFIEFDKAKEKFPILEAEGYVKTMKYLYNHGYLEKFYKDKPNDLSETLIKIEFQAFILELYDELSKDNSWFGFISSWFCTKADRYKYISEFATKEYWEGKNSDKVINEFLHSFCLNKDGKVNLKDKALKTFLAKLSRADTAQKLKIEFIKKMSIEINTCSNDIEKDIINHKFTAQNIDDYLDPYNLKDVKINGEHIDKAFELEAVRV